MLPNYIATGGSLQDQLTELTDYVMRLKKELEYYLESGNTRLASATYMARAAMAPTAIATLQAQSDQLQQNTQNQYVQLTPQGLLVTGGKLTVLDEQGNPAIWFNNWLHINTKEET